MNKEMFAKRFKKEQLFLIKQWSRLVTELMPFLFILTGAVGYFYQKESENWVQNTKSLVIVVSILVSIFIYFGKVRTHVILPDLFYCSRQQRNIRRHFLIFWLESLMLRIPGIILFTFILLGMRALNGMESGFYGICYFLLILCFQGMDFYLQLHQFESSFHWTELSRIFTILSFWSGILFFQLEWIALIILVIIFLICGVLLKKPDSFVSLEKMIMYEEKRRQDQLAFFRWFYELPTPGESNQMIINHSQVKFPISQAFEASAGNYYLVRVLARDGQFMQLIMVWFTVLTVLLYTFAFTRFSDIIWAVGLWITCSSFFEKVHEKMLLLQQKSLKNYDNDQLLVTYGLSIVLLIAVVLMQVILHGTEALFYLWGIFIIFLNYFLKKRKLQ